MKLFMGGGGKKDSLDTHQQHSETAAPAPAAEGGAPTAAAAAAAAASIKAGAAGEVVIDNDSGGGMLHLHIQHDAVNHHHHQQPPLQYTRKMFSRQVVPSLPLHSSSSNGAVGAGGGGGGCSTPTSARSSLDGGAVEGPPRKLSSFKKLTITMRNFAAGGHSRDNSRGENAAMAGGPVLLKECAFEINGRAAEEAAHEALKWDAEMEKELCGGDGKVCRPEYISEAKQVNLSVRISSSTDIGGSHENQDDYFIWRHEESSSFVMGVFDGHGRDVGKLASRIARDFSMHWLQDHWDDMYKNPAEACHDMFCEAHKALLRDVKHHMEQEKWMVMITGQGYLMKRRSNTLPWSCIHGGTSGSVVIHIGGTGKLIVANVGDSEGLLCLKDRELRRDDMVQLRAWEDGGGVMRPPTEQIPGTVWDGHPPRDASTCNAVPLTANHSPESLREFLRMRKTHPHPENNNLPDLLVVYDAPTPYKMKCNPVFRVTRDGVPTITNQGKYYKNVRKEWASLVATPQRARFQDALAFTRSLGDFHLHAYGVSCIPDVQTIDIAGLFHREQVVSETVGDIMKCCIVLCTDGVWDNWEYEEVTDYVMQPERLDHLEATNSAHDACRDFMAENVRRSTANFGSQADNATAILCYLTVTDAD